MKHKVLLLRRTHTMAYLTTCINSSDSVALNNRITLSSGLERVWKKLPRPYLICWCAVCLEVLNKTTCLCLDSWCVLHTCVQHNFYAPVLMISSVKIAPGAMVCNECELLGDITIGSMTVIHPKASIIAEAGPIIIGECNIVEEQARIINRLEVDTFDLES